MADLKSCLERSGFNNVSTYIQSGNVLFTGPKTAAARLAREIEEAIRERFAADVGVALFTAGEWRAVVQRAPAWWGKDNGWKHNLLALLPGTEPAEVIAATGAVKPEVERFEAGDAVIYQSLTGAAVGRTTTSKLPSHPIFRRITIRNYNTTLKLAELLAARADLSK